MQTIMSPSRGLPLPLALLPVFVAVFAVLAGVVATRTITMKPVSVADAGSADSVTMNIATSATAAAEADADVVETTTVEAAPVIVAAGKAPQGAGMIAAAFAPSVQYWSGDIVRWAAAHDLDPNLVATVMQIESCGDPQAVSGAGARGLFQVMPFHFAAGEDMLDPATNAARGMAYLAQGLATASGNAGLALAGYNGGHSVIGQGSYTWPDETQRYYKWGSGIYEEVSANPDTSATLEAWLAAGGSSLCRSAEANLGLAQ